MAEPQPRQVQRLQHGVSVSGAAGSETTECDESRPQETQQRRPGLMATDECRKPV